MSSGDGYIIPLVVLVVAFQFSIQASVCCEYFLNIEVDVAIRHCCSRRDAADTRGDIDISVGSTAGFGAVFSTFLMMQFKCFGLLDTPYEWIGVIGLMIITMAVCSLVGFFNAFFDCGYKLPPFITTIATLYACAAH
jgi:ribose/xylose/arabinose/galactoside ABC-type transport system permease subunit